MITSEDIAILVRSTLTTACTDLTVSWQRHGYEKTNEVVIVPHMATGEGSIRTCIVKVNIHVPDIYDTANGCYETDFSTIKSIRDRVVNALKHHVEGTIGTNWRIESLDPPIKEPQYNEHFASVNIEAFVRERNN